MGSITRDEQGYRLLAGRYRLGSELGRGGMGVVWRGEDTLLGRDVAVKELRLPNTLDLDERDSRQQRMLREARSAARIAHPNVIRVYDVVIDGGQPWIVMEYVPGVSLGDLLVRGPIPPVEAARIGVGVLDGLSAAHSAGILHRDVKPSNVILCEDGRIILTDFGIARIQGDNTLTGAGAVLGSPDYMAPERARGLPPGPASDLWALGATLYTAVEGRTPFHRDTPIAVMAAVVSDEPGEFRYSGPLEPVLRAVLAKSPADRPSPRQARAMLTAVHEQRRPAGAGGAPALAAPRPVRPLSAGPVSRPALGPPVPPDPPAAALPTGPAVAPAPVEAAAAPAALSVPAAQVGPVVPVGPAPVAVAVPAGPAVQPAAPVAGSDSSQLADRLDAARRQAAALAVAATQFARRLGFSRFAPASVAVGACAVLVLGGFALWPSSQPPSGPGSVAVDPGGEPQLPPNPPPDVDGQRGPDLPSVGSATRYRDGSDFSLEVPKGWAHRVTERPYEVSFVDPSDTHLLRVGWKEPKETRGRQASEPYRDRYAAERAGYGQRRDYQRIRLAAAPIREWPGAIWEFRFKGRDGRTRHAYNVAFLVRDRLYTVHYSTLERDWAATKPLYDRAIQTFRPGTG